MTNFWLNKETCKLENAEQVWQQVLDFKRDITAGEKTIINDVEIDQDDADDLYNKLTELLEKGKVNILDYQVTDTAYLMLEKFK